VGEVVFLATLKPVTLTAYCRKAALPSCLFLTRREPCGGYVRLQGLSPPKVTGFPTLPEIDRGSLTRTVQRSCSAPEKLPLVKSLIVYLPFYFPVTIGGPFFFFFFFPGPCINERPSSFCCILWQFACALFYSSLSSFLLSDSL